MCVFPLGADSLFTNSVFEVTVQKTTTADEEGLQAGVGGVACAALQESQL